MKSIQIDIAVERTIKLMPEWMDTIANYVREKWDMKPADPIHEHDLLQGAMELGFIPNIHDNWETVEDDTWNTADFVEVRNSVAKAKKREQKRQAKNL